MNRPPTGWSAFKASVALMWRRKVAVLGFLIVEAMLYGTFAALEPANPHAVLNSLHTVAVAPYAAEVLFFFLMGLAAYLLYNHYMVTALRGRPVLVPERPVGRYLRFLWTVIKTCLAAVGLAAVCFLPFAVLAGMFPTLRHSTAAMVVAAMVGFALVLWLVAVVLRLNLALPGAIAGDRTTLRAAWRLSRGHGLGLLFSAFLLSLFAFFGTMLLILPILLTAGPRSPALVFGTAVCQGFFGLLGVTLNCVWYVGLADDVPERGAPAHVEDLAAKVREGYYGGGNPDRDDVTIR